MTESLAKVGGAKVGVGRDWLAELQGTEDQEVFADLVIAAAAAGVPEAEVCEVAEEKFGWEDWARGIFAAARERKAKAETVPVVVPVAVKPKSLRRKLN